MSEVDQTSLVVKMSDQSQSKTELLIYKTAVKTEQVMDNIVMDKFNTRESRVEAVLEQVYRTTLILVLIFLVCGVLWLTRVVRTQLIRRRVDENRVLRRSLEILAEVSLSSNNPQHPSSSNEPIEV